MAFGLAHAGLLPAGGPLYRRVAAAVAERSARSLAESPVCVRERDRQTDTETETETETETDGRTDRQADRER